MKTKGVGKFLRCFKPTGVVDDDDGLSERKCKCKGRIISDDLGDENIFVSSNSCDGDEETKPKRKHKKIPRFLKEMRNKLVGVKSKGKSTLETPKDGNSELAAQFHRDSSDSSSSIFTSSSMALSSLASTPMGSASSSGSIPIKLKSSLSMKRTCSNDQEQATIEAQNNINNNINKQDLMEKAGGCYFGSEYGIWFVMLGLMALLIWGKVVATFFTSLCLYSASPRRLKVINNNPQEILDDTSMLINELSCENQVIMA
ncbi:hypothetical protein Leryth_027609 [Lithospermum erythrorhizon]|nr:hypothetical protein Leryth_027609 [Lithospermum erythrorhizon]